MTDDQAAKQYQFAPSADLPVVFSTLEIEYLTVSEKRAIAIYTQAVLDIEVIDGRLANAHTIDIEVLDYSAGGDDSDPESLIETLIDRISSRTETDTFEMDN